MFNMSEIWTDDQIDLLDYSLTNILDSFQKVDHFKSNCYYTAVPFSIGYRLFDIKCQTLQQAIIQALEILRKQEIDRVNIEIDGGFPILTVFLETGPTIIIEDIITGKMITNIGL